MSTDDRMERLLVELLAEEAPSRPPDRLIPETVRVLRHERRWPRWYALMKEPPMRYSSRVAVGSPAVRLIVAAAVSLLLLLTTLAAVAAGATVLSADNVPAPFGPARNGAIVYARDGDIYLADADGGNERAIVGGPTDDSDPWFSHDGRRIAFGRASSGSTALMLANTDGSDVRELIDDAGDFSAFSASDAEMILIREAEGRKILSIVDVGSGQIRDLDLDGIEPGDWTLPRPPDGREIVFVGYPVPGEPALGLYGIGMDGTGLRTIGDISADESPRWEAAPTRWSMQSPSFSPDGRTIAFWNWEPSGRSASNAGGYASASDYLHMRDLTTGAELPVPFAGAGGSGNGPRFSPDGTHILFETSAVTGQGKSQLYDARVDGSQTPIPLGPAYDYTNRRGWDVSPDGAEVLISLGAPSATSMVNVLTGDVTELPDVGEEWGWQRLAP
jgi:Tol biopolymer transport system component